jgi:pilus assembly protein CpaE
VNVLASSDAYTPAASGVGRTVGKLVEVFRNQYPYVVIDAGRGLGDGAEPLFQMAGTIFLVTQLDIPSLRNTQRFISYVQQMGAEHIEVVVNRFETRKTEFNEERVTEAIGLAPKWKIPNDYGAVHRSANTGSPFVLEKSPAAQALRAMARAASGKPAVAERKKGWSLL